MVVLGTWSRWRMGATFEVFWASSVCFVVFLLCSSLSLSLFCSFFALYTLFLKKNHLINFDVEEYDAGGFAKPPTS